MNSPRRTAALGAALASTTLLLAACGGGEASKSGAQIVNDAKAALRSASSFHIAGTVTGNDSTIKLDVKVQGKGTASGHMEQGGVGFDFVSKDGKLYFRGKELFAQVASQDVADSIGNRWVVAPSDDSHLSDAISSVNDFSDASGFADSLGRSGGPYTTAGTTTVDGQQAVVVKSKDGTMDVAASGPAYPLHLDGGSKGSLDINDYGQRFGISAPSGALDVSVLEATASKNSSSTTSTDSGSDTTKAVVDAAKVRDGVLDIAQATITDSSGDASGAWGMAAALTSKLPSNIDVSVQTGDLSSQSAATPTDVVLFVQQGDSGDVFGVVVLDSNGTCAAGELTGTPPNAHPQTATVPSGEDCTAANALQALGG